MILRERRIVSDTTVKTWLIERKTMGFSWSMRKELYRLRQTGIRSEYSLLYGGLQDCV